MCYFENGDEFKSDVYRRINKFDIFYCDLGPIDDIAINNNTLGKERPCVIVSSDELSHPKANQYIVVPIRTEHNLNVYKETLESIVKDRMKVGRVYVPIEMKADDYRFIDITQIRQVPMCKIKNYVGTIMNPELKKRINKALFKALFSPGELKLNKSEVQNNQTEIPAPALPTTVVNTPNTTEVKTDTKEPVKAENLQQPEVDSEIARKIGFALQAVEEKNNEKSNGDKLFIELYEKVNKNILTRYEASKKMGVSISAFNNLVSEYEAKNNINKAVEKKPTTNTTQKCARGQIPQGFSLYYKMYKDKKMTVPQIAEKMGRHYTTVYDYIHKYEKMQSNY